MELSSLRSGCFGSIILAATYTELSPSFDWSLSLCKIRNKQEEKFGRCGQPICFHVYGDVSVSPSMLNHFFSTVNTTLSQKVWWPSQSFSNVSIELLVKKRIHLHSTIYFLVGRLKSFTSYEKTVSNTKVHFHADKMGKLASIYQTFHIKSKENKDTTLCMLETINLVKLISIVWILEVNLTHKSILLWDVKSGGNKPGSFTWFLVWQCISHMTVDLLCYFHFWEFWTLFGF